MNIKHIIVVAVALVALFNLSVFTANAQVIPGCGAYGIDLSPLNAMDINATLNGYTWVIRTCGQVADAICNNDPTANRSSVCQRGASTANQAYGLSFWNATKPIYSRSRSGIYQQLITGEMCGANPRQSNIYYQCDPTATTPQLISASEPTQCAYSFTVLTNITCPLPQERPCVFDGIDLNPMFAAGEISFNSTFRWYFRMCSTAPTNFLCANDSTANHTMVCQQRLDGSDSFNIASYDESNVAWQSIPTGNNAGLLITVPNGEFCAAIGRNRSARIQLVCDPTLGVSGSYIYGAAETSTCVYQLTVRTSLSCPAVRVDSSTGTSLSLSSSWWPNSGPQVCFFNGLNFSDLYFNPDLYWGGFINNIYYEFYYHMCGTVRNRQCLQDSSTYNSMLCQTSVTNAQDNYALDYFVPSNWIWTNTTYGMKYVTRIGELCGSSRRTITVEFECDHGEARISNIFNDPLNTCNYIFTVKTGVVCSVAPLPPSSTGPVAPIPDCVYNNWDFKRLTPGNNDLTFDTRAGSTNYTIYLKMCSVVAQPGCRRDFTATQAMVCQRRIDGLDTYSLGDYNPLNQNWTEDTASSTIQMVVGGGEMCGANPRRTVVTFVCDPSYTNRTGNATGITLFNETSTCVYALTVVANNIICPYFARSGGNLTVSSSSSSSGGFGNESSSGSASGDGCISAANVPDGSITYALVFNVSVASLPPRFFETLISALRSSIHSDQFVCGQVVSGDRIGNANINGTTDSQTVAVFYVVPGSESPETIRSRTNDILNNNISAIRAQFPSGFPTLEPTYMDISCPNGQVADVTTQACAPRPTDDSSSGLSDGAIAGIVVGSVVGGLLLLALCACLVLRGRKSSGSEGRSVEMTSK